MPEIHPENHPNDPFFPREEYNRKAIVRAKQVDGVKTAEQLRVELGLNPDGIQYPGMQIVSQKADIPRQRRVHFTNKPIPVDERYPDDVPDTRTRDEIIRDGFISHIYSEVVERRHELEDPEVPDQKPLFFVFEGGEGSGKSTLAKMLYAKLREWRVPVILTREPGGSDMGAHIREILMNPATAPKSRRAELMLFLADRAEHVETVIKPGLDKGYVVICDRFHASTLAYQGFGPKEQADDNPAQIPHELIEGFSWWAADNVTPDVTYLLDIDPQIGLRRSKAVASNRYEDLDVEYHHRVRRAFSLQYWQAQKADGDNGDWVLVDASKPLVDVTEFILRDAWMKVEKFGYFPEVDEATATKAPAEPFVKPKSEVDPAAWRDKHPCVKCGDGYGICLRDLSSGVTCCNKCDHPSRWNTHPPYTPEEILEMRKRG